MTIQKLASKIAMREGKKSQARIGDIREILGIVSDVLYEQRDCALCLYEMLEKNGKRRAKRKPQKKK